MSEGNFQRPQTVWKKFSPLPTEPRDFPALHSVFYQNKKLYHDQLTGEERSLLSIDYAEICLRMLSTIIDYRRTWNIDEIIIRKMKKCKRELEFHVENYSKIREDVEQDKRPRQELKAETLLFKECVERTEDLIDELNEMFQVLVRARREEVGQEGSLQTGLGPKPEFTSRQRVEPESINPDHYNELKQTWTECCVTAALCNKVINKLHRINESDEEFVKKSLQEIHGEIIVGFCDDLRSYCDLLPISPLGQQLACVRRGFPDLLKEADNLKNHVLHVDVQRMHKSFKRMWRRLIFVRRLTRCYFGFG